MKRTYNRTRRRATLLSTGLFALAATCGSVSAFAQSAPKVERGPINPAFFDSRGDSLALFGRPKINYGAHAGPLGLPHMLSSEVLWDSVTTTVIPPTYDLRQTGKLSPIENQGQCGDCWAFATMGSLESNLLPGQLCSFSENNLKDTSGFDYGWNGGGNRDMSTAYFARWSGPVNTSQDPYNPSSGVSPTNLAPVKHVQEVLYLPDKASATDNTAIKQAIMNYGAVFTYMEMDESLLVSSGKTTTYYEPGGTGINHAIDIVGWDDNFDKSRFATAPPGNGAFLCRNSWGASFGDGGYFYVSYYDKWVGRSGGNTVFDDAEPVSNFNHIYQYDPLGCVSSIGLSGKTTVWFANVFTATAADNVAGVSFYTLAANTAYTIHVYNNATGGPVTSGSGFTTVTGTVATPGYHTVAMTTPLKLVANQKFSVVVEVSANTSSIIPVQFPMSGYSSQAPSAAGESFASIDGTHWYDLTTLQAKTIACVKVFTQQAPVTVTSTAITASAASGVYGQTVPLKAVLQSGTPAAALASKTLSFLVNGAAVGTGVTDSTGTATCNVTLPATYSLGANTITVNYAGDGSTKASTATATLTVAKMPTKLAVNSPTSKVGTKVVLSAVMTRGFDGAAMSGRTISFSVNSGAAVTATTDATGTATMTYTIATNAAVGKVNYAATFAGDAVRVTSTATGSITVTAK